MSTSRTKRRGAGDSTKPQATAADRAMPRESAVPREAVARLAHELFLGRGGSHGHDLDDWLEAERQLSSRAS